MSIKKVLLISLFLCLSVTNVFALNLDFNVKGSANFIPTDISEISDIIEPSIVIFNKPNIFTFISFLIQKNEYTLFQFKDNKFYLEFHYSSFKSSFNIDLDLYQIISQRITAFGGYEIKGILNDKISETKFNYILYFYEINGKTYYNLSVGSESEIMFLSGDYEINRIYSNDLRQIKILHLTETNIIEEEYEKELVLHKINRQKELTKNEIVRDENLEKENWKGSNIKGIWLEYNIEKDKIKNKFDETINTLKTNKDIKINNIDNYWEEKEKSLKLWKFEQ